MKRSKTRLLIESSLMVALATVLSIFKFVEMPYGGSVTMASMMPIVILSYRNGPLWGLSGGLAYAVIQQLLGLKHLSYFTTWQSVVAIILLDYLVAFTVAGLGGIFRSKKLSQRSSLMLGGALVSLLRYICHTVAGATVWVGLSIPDSAALIYSIGYNATYMIPETVVLLGTIYYLGGILDFTKDIPVRLVRTEAAEAKNGGLYALCGGALLLGLVVDILLIAPYTQNPDTGMFDLSCLKDAEWLAVAIVSVICIVCAVFTFIYARRSNKNAHNA